MCRILAIAGDMPEPKTLRVLREFRKLADCGCVPPGYPAGHKDGWGMASYRKGKLATYVRRVRDAAADPSYPATIRRATAGRPEVLIMHFRKASVGGNRLFNTHPFARGRFTFCHNGAIHHSARIPLSPAARKRVKGTTDSELLFQYLLSRIPKTATSTEVTAAIKDSVKLARKLGYTALNCFLTDGRRLWALREVNPRNPFVRRGNLLRKYYTLFIGKTAGPGRGVIISSEKLSVPGIRWRAFRNHELVIIEEKY
ncbi:MAG: class II glutamine amidotransferase [Candidatus Liptonbacteria bacterium]|nr:class II glutamine amidotransferase [Candidatus Liptonbacteria bacterium]